MSTTELAGIGVRLKEIRKSKGLILQAVAERAGISKSLLSKIENFRTIPSLSVLYRIAEALQTDLADLVSRVGS